MSLKVFISYAHADQALYKKLEEHLSVLEYSGKITIWQDQEIPPGANWEDQINAHLNDADMILLLVSASFISSKYCWNREVQVALERHKAGTARVIPIILRPALWEETPLGQLQALPTGAKPVVQWGDQDIAFDNVAQGIREMVKDLLRTLETNTHTSDLQTAASGVPLAVSSPQEALQTGQPLLRQWLVTGGITALVLILLSTGGVWLSRHSNPTKTDLNQRPTLTNTVAARPRQEHSIGVITEYLIPTPDAQADSITLGPDGNLWFTEDNAAKIGWITPQGHITEPLQLATGSNPAVIVPGSDGNLWVLENGITKVARVTPQGHITQFPVTPRSNLVGLAAGKDGNLWFTEFQTNKIGRMNTSGKITGEFLIPTLNSGVAWITQGPDGNLWFDEQRGNQIGRITPNGHITEFPYSTSPISGTDNNHNLAAGPDGNVWFTDFWHSQIGKITPQGVITEYSLPTLDSVPSGITSGPDGNVWFTECVPNSSRTSCENSSKIGKITSQGVITEYSLPTPNSEPAGIIAGPDGNLWFTEDPGNKIGKITTGQ